ncbi:MAG: AbrB/MazE/SpoVT family DNA-binding domain-containing protein [Verrucomicrobia bacterium]|nr:AbrB/MazE/SpoVT family DNA-binding domain-containing protein [Verrucomicrobiota bacterium]
MKDFDVMTISKVGQSTFPKAWLLAAGLERGGVVEVRFLRDGRQSLLLTPKPRKRTGAVGLLQALRSCPVALPEVVRHSLPFK